MAVVGLSVGESEGRGCRPDSRRLSLAASISEIVSVVQISYPQSVPPITHCCASFLCSLLKLLLFRDHHFETFTEATDAIGGSLDGVFCTEAWWD